MMDGLTDDGRAQEDRVDGPVLMVTARADGQGLLDYFRPPVDGP